MNERRDWRSPSPVLSLWLVTSR